MLAAETQHVEQDPFEVVVVEKHLDNPLMTSNRTIQGLNNTVSSSLKIVHNKFTALSQQEAFKADSKINRARKQNLKH
jgi:ribosomal protein S18